MIYIKNKYYPFGSFRAITHWPFVFYKKLGENTKDHERIHAAQQKELFLIGFYLIYLFEYFILRKKYRDISFEKEAYANASNKQYLSTRKKYAQWRS